MIRRLIAATCLVAAPAAALLAQAALRPLPRLVPSDSVERHLRNVTQLTDGGENAESYFSHDGKWLTFQSTRDGRSCDQQYVMRLSDAKSTRISTGTGKTTCGWFFPGDRFGLMQWLGLPSAQLHDVFPNLVNFQQKTIPLLRT